MKHKSIKFTQFGREYGQVTAPERLHYIKETGGTLLILPVKFIQTCVTRNVIQSTDMS